MKAIWLILFLLVGGACAAAASKTPTYEVNGFKVKFTSLGGIQRVDSDASGVVTIPETIDDRTVRSVESSAFRGCNKITKIIFPSTLTYCNTTCVFYGCTNLVEIVGLPDSGSSSIGPSCCDSCYKLTEFPISDSVTKIGEYAFRWCHKLELSKLPQNIKKIGSQSFQGCHRITISEIPSTVTSIGEGAFQYCDSIKEMSFMNSGDTGHTSFSNCKNLETVSFGNKVTSIGLWSFASCNALSKVSISPSITSIKASAFCGCESLESIEIPDTVQTVGGSCFYGCRKLKSCKLPSHVTTIPGSFFSGCGFENLCIPERFTEIDDSAFANCTNLVSVTLPSCLKEVGYCVFSGCTSLRKIEFPLSVTNIGKGAFMDCDSLSSIVITDSILGIGDCAFQGCSSLVKAKIGDGITSFHGSVVGSGDRAASGAFAYCENLKTLILGRNVARIGCAATTGCTNLSDVVFMGAPPVCSDAYQWGRYLYDPFADGPNDARGWYTAEHADEWNEVISNGIWHHLNMRRLVAPADLDVKIQANKALVKWSAEGASSETLFDIYRGTNAEFSAACCIATNVTAMAWDDLTFRQEYTSSNAFELNYWVVAKDGDFEMGRSDVATVTIQPQKDLKPVMLMPEYDIETGHLNLLWECTNSTADVRYDVYRSSSGLDDPAYDLKIGKDLSSMVCIDTNYLDRTTQFPHVGLHYYVIAKRNNGEAVQSGVVKANNRYGLSLGISEFEMEQGGQGEEYLPWQDDLLRADDDAELFDRLYCETIGGNGYCKCFINDEAKKDDIRVEWQDMARKAMPGDIVTLYIASHCGDNGDGKGPAICTYEVDGLYTLAELSDDINAFNKGVRVIVILDACESASMMPAGDVCADAVLSRCNGGNIGWIGASAADEDAIDGALGEWFLTHGWNERYALGEVLNSNCDDLSDVPNGNLLTFLRLARYAKNFIVGKWLEPQTVQISGNARVLETVAAKGKSYPGAMKIVQTPILNATRTVYPAGTVSSNMAVTLSWLPVENATHYRIYREEDGGESKVIETVGSVTNWTDRVPSNDDPEGMYPAPQEGVSYTYCLQPLNPSGFGVLSSPQVGWIAVEKNAGENLPDLGENTTSVEVGLALYGSADEKLHANISNGKEYDRFRGWAQNVKDGTGLIVGLETVKNAPHAWVSFALGSDKLLSEPPTDDDLTVEEFEPASETGKYDFTVSVEGVEVGSEAQEENLKQVFGLEGSTSLSSDGFSSENVDITFDTPQDGKVKFTAGPKNTDAKSFFMKVKVNP